MEKEFKPRLYLSYTNEFGDIVSTNNSVAFNDSESQLSTLFDIFARFMVMVGYSPENVKEFYPEI